MEGDWTMGGKIIHELKNDAVMYRLQPWGRLLTNLSHERVILQLTISFLSQKNVSSSNKGLGIINFHIPGAPVGVIL